MYGELLKVDSLALCLILVDVPMVEQKPQRVLVKWSSS